MVKIPFPEPEYSARKQQPGRNDPCPCGSGKKYKQCCMNKESRQSSAESLWRRLRETNDKLADEMMTFFRENLGEEALLDAWDDYRNLRYDREFNFHDPEIQSFFPWMLFNWLIELSDEDPEADEYDDADMLPGAIKTDGPKYDDDDDDAELDDEDFDDEDDEDLDDEDIPDLLAIGEIYLAERGHRLTEMEKRFIELNVATNYSFHEVLNCQPGKGFTLRDLLLGSELFVYEKSASLSAKAGDIIFAKVIRYDEVGMICGCGAVLIPPVHKIAIIDLREAMQDEFEEDSLSEEDLYEWDIEIRDLYHDIYDAMHAPPQLHNTDGDPIVWHDLYFDLHATPQEAFDALRSLSLDTTEEEFQDEVDYDADGNLLSIEFRWIRRSKKGFPGDYTTLGHIMIRNKEIRVSVNSENRAKKIRKEIKKRLGQRVVFREMEVKTREEMMEETPDKSSGPIPPEDYTPELIDAIGEILAGHWKTWPDEKIPALGNITPRQAAKTRVGREKLIALLDDMERQERNSSIPGMSQLKHILQIRKELGL